MSKVSGVAADLDKALNLFNIALPFTLSDLKKKYRELSRDNHPDRYIVGPGRDAADEQMSIINVSFKLLGQCASDDRTDDEKLLMDKETLIARLSKDPYSVYETCRSCRGDKLVTHTRVIGHTDCHDCDGHGFTESLCKDCYGTGIFLGGVKELPCSVCDSTGSFKTKSGNIVPCLKCEGTGVFQVKYKNQYKCRSCSGTGNAIKNCPTCASVGVIAIEKTEKEVCPACLGVGEVKMDLWNPVIRPGAIMTMGICNKKNKSQRKAVAQS